MIILGLDVSSGLCFLSAGGITLFLLNVEVVLAVSVLVKKGNEAVLAAV